MRRTLTIALMFLLAMALTGIVQAAEYLVQKGDTLWSIAAKQLNNPDKWKDILAANPSIKDARWIHPGDKLIIPDVATTAEAAPAAAEPEVKIEPKAETPVAPVVTTKNEPAEEKAEVKAEVKEVKAEVKAEEKKEAAPVAVETAQAETKAEDATLQPDQAGEVKEETPIAANAEAAKEAASETASGEKYDMPNSSSKVSSTITGILTIGKGPQKPFDKESVPLAQFKATAKITAYNPSDKNDKTMFSNGDLLVISAGSNKGLEAGAMVNIYKVGKLMTERGTLDEPNQTKYENKQETVMVNKIGEATVKDVKNSSSYIEIIRCTEPVTVGDLIKLSN